MMMSHLQESIYLADVVTQVRGRKKEREIEREREGGKGSGGGGRVRRETKLNGRGRDKEKNIRSMTTTRFYSFPIIVHVDPIQQSAGSAWHVCIQAWDDQGCS